MTEQDPHHNPDPFAYQRWKSPDLRPLPKPASSPQQEFLERAKELYPRRDDNDFLVGDSTQSELRERLKNLHSSQDDQSPDIP